MTHPFKLAFIALLALGVLVAWTGQPPVTYTFQSTPSEMNVEGGSTLHDWSCPIKTLGGTMQVDTAGTADSPIGAPSRGQVEVPVDAIQCDKDTMNEKLREALKINAYPEVYFNLKDAQVSPLPDSGNAWFMINAKGELLLSGKRRQIELPVKGKRLENGDLRLVGSHTIRLSDYGIERPSAMLGAIKTSKQVTVNFDVTATPTSQ